MDNEMMDLEQLASYLSRDVREISKMADRGHLPGQKIGGQWRFTSSEINQWIYRQLPDFSDQQLTALENPGTKKLPEEILVSHLLSEATVAVPLNARTRASVLSELVILAEQTWQIYDPPVLLQALKQREEMGSTALAEGVAFPHPRRPLSDKAQGESVIAFGSIPAGVPFGAPNGTLTDLFFLICCRDIPTHLRVLARLSRLLLKPGFADGLREAESPHDAYQWIEQSERALIGE